MKDKVRIIVFAGSLRTGSYNARLAATAADMVEDIGAQVVRLDLRDYPAPIYDGDLEASSGLPDSVVALKRLFVEHDGFLPVSPEYNGSLSPLMKNTVDWLSRRGDDPRPLMPFDGKVVGLLSASPGRLGGLRGLIELRRVLSGIGCHVIPQQFALGGAGGAFGEDGRLTDAASANASRRVVRSLVETARRLT